MSLCPDCLQELSRLDASRLGATLAGGDQDVPWQMYEREDRPGEWWVKVEGQGGRAGRLASDCEIALWQIRCKLVWKLIHHEKQIDALTQRLHAAQDQAEEDGPPILP